MDKSVEFGILMNYENYHSITIFKPSSIYIYNMVIQANPTKIGY